LHSHWQARPPAGGTVRHQLIEALEKAIKSTLDAPEALTEARRLRPELYQPATLGLLINEACRVQSGGLDPLLPLYDRWTAAHPQLPTLLNADGYRLELCRATNRMPTRAEALRAILDLATHTELSRVQEAAVRRQLAEYRDDAVKFPVNSLDQAAGWYFFSVLGSNQTDYGFLDSYREFRARFPEIDQASLLNQPLEVLLVLEKSGASAAFEYAVRQGTHGGMMMLAEWLRAHPALIREPLPLPVVKEGQPYPYRPVKFMRIFAPFADEAAMNSEPQIAAAYEILARDPRWIQVAKQARATNAGPSAKEKK
jgi:hypothetical protein